MINIGDKELVSRILKEFLPFDKKKDIVRIIGNDRADISQEKLVKWPTSIVEVFNVGSHRGNSNQNHSKILPHTCPTG